jgi:NADH pyrophosphatase NudC (nudix superfamily)
VRETIYRDDAIKAMRECFQLLARPRVTAIKAINAIPSADRPQGEWIDAEIPLESGGSMPIQVCNLCKTFYPLAYTGGGHRFCPNCGARMKGADDED